MDEDEGTTNCARVHALATSEAKNSVSASHLLRFAGLGYRCLPELTSQYKESSACKTFVDLVCEGLVQKIKLLGYETPLVQIRAWIQNIRGSELATGEEIAKKNCGVSGPLIALAQFVRVWKLCEESSEDSFLDTMRSRFGHVTGHSQGIVTAIAFAGSGTRYEFITNCIIVLVLLFLVGYHAEQIVARKNPNEAGAPAMLIVRRITHEKLSELVNEFNSGVINDVDTFVVSGLPGVIRNFQQSLEGQTTRLLSITAPFHSPILEAALDPVIQDSTSVSIKFSPRALNFPVYSCADGQDLRKATKTDLLPVLVKLLLSEPLDWPRAMSVACAESHDVLDMTPGGSSLPLSKRIATSVGQSLLTRDPEEEQILSSLHRIASEMYPLLALSDDIPLVALGFDSLAIEQFSHRIGEAVGAPVSVGFVFGAGCLSEIATQMAKMLKKDCSVPSLVSDPNRRNQEASIAIISYGMRFPNDVNDLTSFWDMLSQGVENKSVPNLDMFDPDFFSIPQSEANRMDPQHRLLLECSWEALERCGYAPGGANLSSSLASTTGVFVGVWSSDYRDLQLIDGKPADRFFSSGGSKSMAAGRIAFHFNLGGPAFSVDTACSSSLVALHLACGSLRSGECNLAISGGVNLILAPSITEGFRAAKMLSTTDHCLAFDESADGYARGEGCATVVLKRLSDAVAAGDPILGVILGSSTNNNGKTTSIITPSTSQQRQVILSALQDAQIRADEVSYLEAHGTGTQLGDVIEMEALQSVFKSVTVGTVKANLGHLESAAGIAGVMKVLAMLQHKAIPPHPSLKQLNKRIPPGGATINTQLIDWKAESKLVAGVSSFGFSGTNAHVIIAEAPKVASTETTRTIQSPTIVVVSSKSERSLREICKKLYIVGGTMCLVDFAHTMSLRPQFRYRLAIIAQTSEELAQELKQFGEGGMGKKTKYGVLNTTNVTGQPRPIFLFPGQGTNFLPYARDVYNQCSTFRHFLRKCDSLLPSSVQPSIISCLTDTNTRDSEMTDYWLQIALFTIEWSLAQTFLSWGVKPSCLIGHSLGELVSACVAGEFSLEQGLRLVEVRSRLLSSSTPGSMLATQATLEQLQMLRLTEYIAAINSVKNYTLSGSEQAMESAAVSLQEIGVRTKKLETKHAFHSHLVETILAEFEQEASKLKFSAPALPVGNTIQGKLWTTKDGSRDSKYWRSQIRSTVNFRGCVDSALAVGHKKQFLELGPTSLLSMLADSNNETNEDLSLLPTMRKGTNFPIASSLSKLYINGAKISWSKVNPPGNLLDLPTYEFDRRRCWLDSMQPEFPSLHPTSPQRLRRQTIRGVVSRIYGREVGDNENLMMLGMDSLMTTELRLAISSILPNLRGVLPSAFFSEYPTVEHIARFVKQNKKSDLSMAGLVVTLWHPSPMKGEKALPLSGIQRAYWLGKQSLGGSGGHLYREYEIPGKFDVNILQRAVNEMAQRHPILRAVITKDGLLKILSEVPTWAPKVLKDSDEVAVSSARDALQKGPDVHKWPLFDAVVVEGATSSVVMANISLFLLDGYTEKIIGDEILRYFLGRQPPAPSLLNYMDCLKGLNKLRHSSAYEKARKYWRLRISGFPGRPELPLNANPGMQQHLLFEHHERRLPQELWEAIKQICAEHGTSPNTLLLSLYLQLLARWSQNKTFALTVMMTRRTARVHPELEKVMGNLSSTLLIAANCENGDVSLDQFTHEVANEVAIALDNSAMDGIEVVQEINKQLKRPFDAYAPFAFSSVVGVSYDYSEYLSKQAKRRYSCATLPHTWMDLQTSEEAGSLLYSFDILKDVFPKTVVAQMVDAYEYLLLAASKRESWKQVLTSLFRTPAVAEPVSLPREVPDVLLYEPFLERVNKNPSKIAVVDGKVRVTYADLSKHSYAVAVTLPQSSEIDVVAVLLPKGWKQVVATLGILRAHKTYMPLDPKLPKHRIEYLLRASGAVAIATDTETQKTCLLDTELVFLDLDKMTYDPGVPLKPTPISSMTTAYLLYTSGSTGAPKGVCCHHLGAYNTCIDLLERFGITESDSLLSLSSLSFDLSVFDIFGMLAAGGTIVMPPSDGSLEPELWLEAVDKHHVSVWNTVPAFMELLLTAANICHRLLPASLRVVMMSGDLVPPALPQRIRNTSSNQESLRVICMGGATEAAIWSNMYDTSEKFSWNSIPYGRPLRNQTMIILDPNMQLCEEWVVGVIHIGGVGVANGYLNDEKQTTDHFLETQKFGRLFRTGDLGRLRDGLLEILGREDSQVKLNGFRIELGEIERTAGRFSSINDCCVVVTQSSLLVAYLVPSDTEFSGDFGKLREYLRERLPHYMVPHLFVQMTSLPLTSNGKIDRKLLTALANEQHSHPSSHSKKPPGTDQEKLLYSIISQVLHFDDFGVDDDLFELGCDSVALLNIIGELRKNGIKLKIADIFSNLTIAKLVTVVQTIDSGIRDLFQVISNPEDQFEPFQMIGIQRGYWLGMYISDAIGGINNHFYREYDVLGDFSTTKMEMAINKLIARHPMLRAVVTDSGEVAQLREVPFWKLLVFKIELGQKFELEKERERILRGPDPHKWPLWQLEVYQLDENRWYILLDTSIMMLDGVATGILVSEFLKFYNAPDFQMDPLSLTFRDYALAHQNLAMTSSYQEAKAYWLNRIDDLPFAPLLPTLTPQSSDGQGAARDRHFVHYGGRVSAEIWSQIQQVCTSLQITPTMMCCTLYSEIISHWSHNHHFLITIMHTKRWPVHPEVNDVVGNFSQTVLLEVNISDSSVACFEMHCKRVTRQLTSDLDNAEFTGTDVAQEINRNRRTQFQAVAPFAFTSTLSFDGLSTIPEVKEVTPFSGRRMHSLVTVPHTWMDHQVAEDCGELLYNFDVLEGMFEPKMIMKMVEAYEKILRALCDPNSWQNVPVSFLFEDPEPEINSTVSERQLVMKPRPVKTKDRKPQMKLEKAVAAVVASILRIPQTDVTLGANFFDMGGNSLSALQLIMSLKSKLQINISAAKFFANPTVAALCKERVGDQEIPETSSYKPSLVSLRQSSEYPYNSQSHPLFLIHAAGASVLSYRPLVQHTKFSVVFGVDDCAMLDDEIPFAYNNIEDVVESYSNAISEFLAARELKTCYIGGWSFGGVVAIEVTRKLEGIGITIPKCILFDAPLVRTQEVEDDEHEKRRLEELIEGSGAGGARAIAHFNHCTDLLRKFQTSPEPQILSDVVHIIASETSVLVNLTGELLTSVTKGKVVQLFGTGTHFTMLTEANVTELALTVNAQFGFN